MLYRSFRKRQLPNKVQIKHHIPCNMGHIDIFHTKILFLDGKWWILFTEDYIETWYFVYGCWRLWYFFPCQEWKIIFPNKIHQNMAFPALSAKLNFSESWILLSLETSRMIFLQNAILLYMTKLYRRKSFLSTAK